MDNDAFKALVRSKVKSTKDIAREAVEEAFQHKKKRNQKRKRGNHKKKGRNDDYDYDDDDDQDNYSSSESESESRHPKRGDDKDGGDGEEEDDDDDEQNDSHQCMPSSVRKKKQPRYRDRAKERREGKNDDYKESQNLLQKVGGQDDNISSSAIDAEGAEDTAMNQAELSKYLGGDEAHTHLVKGLDVALARSVRKEMEPTKQQREEGDDSDDNETRLELEDLKPIQTSKEAWSILRQHASTNNDTSRSVDLKKQSILNYYLQTHSRRKQKQTTEAPKASIVAVSSAGSALQRTQLVFAVDWHPTNLARSWEVPVEKSQAAASLQPSALPKVSPLPSELILGMQEKQNRKWHAVVTTATSSVALGKPQDSKEATALGGKPGTNTGPGNGKTAEEDEDSEDDIFPDAGDDSS